MYKFVKKKLKSQMSVEESVPIQWAEVEDREIEEDREDRGD